MSWLRRIRVIKRQSVRPGTAATCWLLAVAPVACASARPEVMAPAGVAQSETEEVVLRAGDAVRLAVHNEPELAGEFPVGPDGHALFPLIGLVRVAGEPFEEVTERVRRAYAAELPSAVVVLVPMMRVAVTGEVRAPSIFVVDPTFTLSDALARSGGLLPTAARGRVILVRDGREYELAYDGAVVMPALEVRSGDHLLIPRRSWVADNLPVLIGSATSVLVAAVTALLVR